MIHALHRVECAGLEADVLVGASNPHVVELEAAARAGRATVRVRTGTTDMPERMSSADVSVGAGGITSWERAFLGLPTLLVVLASNQRPVAAALEAAGVARVLGEPRELTVAGIACALEALLRSAPLRAAMAARGAELVDGLGTERVMAEMEGSVLRLRPVRPEDCRRIWEWACDPAVRAASFSSEPIPWETHVRWFETKLSDPSCVFLIGTHAGDRAVGQVRFDLEDAEATISISLDPGARGKGFAPTLIRTACQELFARGRTEVIHSYVRPENEASVRVFSRAGFRRLDGTHRNGQPAEHWVLLRGTSAAVWVSPKTARATSLPKRPARRMRACTNAPTACDPSAGGGRSSGESTAPAPDSCAATRTSCSTSAGSPAHS